MGVYHICVHIYVHVYFVSAVLPRIDVCDVYICIYVYIHICLIYTYIYIYNIYIYVVRDNNEFVCMSHRYGDILPTNHNERVLNIIAVLIGGLCFAFCLGMLQTVFFFSFFLFFFSSFCPFYRLALH